MILIEYYRIQLDSLARAYPKCLKCVAAAAKLVEVSADLTIGNDVHLQTPHVFQSLLNLAVTEHLSSSRLITYDQLLLSPSNIYLKYNFNPATLFLLSGKGEEHHRESYFLISYCTSTFKAYIPT